MINDVKRSELNSMEKFSRKIDHFDQTARMYKLYTQYEIIFTIIQFSSIE